LNVVFQLEDQLQTTLAKAYQRYHRLKNEHIHWDAWIGQLVEVQVEAKGCPKSQIWQQLQSHKHVRRTAKKVKYMLGKVITHKPLAVDYALDSASRAHQDCTKKWDLESACLAEAGRQFTQAGTTPFLTHPL